MHLGSSVLSITLIPPLKHNCILHLVLSATWADIYRQYFWHDTSMVRQVLPSPLYSLKVGDQAAFLVCVYNTKIRAWSHS